MRILVTGASGFIGQHLVRELNFNHEVVGVDHADGDLREPGVFEQLLGAYEPDTVVHLAAKVGRLFGEDNVMETVRDNAGMTALVAQACGLTDTRLVYASTSEVYGDQGNRTCTENGPLALPHNAYGLTKRWGEEACRLYAPRRLTVWRISMPYGPGLPAGVGRAAIINMLDQASARESIPVHMGAERSWCWVGDTVKAMRLTIEKALKGTFNIGRDDRPVPMRRVAELACELTGAPTTLIQEVPAPPRQTVVKRLDTTKIRKLGWQPKVELEDGMARTLDAMLVNA